MVVTHTVAASRVLGVCIDRELSVGLEAVERVSARIEIFYPFSVIILTHRLSYTSIYIMEPAVTHVGFYLKVHDRLLLTVINAGYTCQVTLSLICLDTADYVYRQVLCGHLLVIAKVLLSVHKDTGYPASVNGNAAVLIDLNTRKTLYKLLQDRALRNTECAHIIHQGIVNHLCGWQGILNHCLGQHDTLLIHLKHT